MTSGSTDDTLPGAEEHTDAGEPMLRPGDLVDGRYRLRERLGAGGMGEVWAVEHVSLRRPMALKLLRAAELATPTQRARFLREAQVVSKIRHPGVVEITDFGELPSGAPFIAMELVGGRTLHRVAHEDGALAWPRAIGLIHQIAEALAEVHRQDVVHRDLKPDNIFVSTGPPESVTVIDFGIARRNVLDAQASKLTATGSVFGTPGYMAPEQIRGEPVDARADVYALGCIAHELITGRRLFEGGLFDRLQAHLYEQAPSLPASLPTAVRRTVERCLAKAPDERFRTMDEVADACAAALGRPAKRRTAVADGHVPVVPMGAATQASRPTAPAVTLDATLPMQPPTPATVLLEPPRRSSARLAVAAVSALIGLVILTLLYVAWNRPEPRATIPTASEPEVPTTVPAETPPPPVQRRPAVAAPTPELPVERAVEKPAPAPEAEPDPSASPRRKKPKAPKAADSSKKKAKGPQLRPDNTYDPFARSDP